MHTSNYFYSFKIKLNKYNTRINMLEFYIYFTRICLLEIELELTISSLISNLRKYHPNLLIC